MKRKWLEERTGRRYRLLHVADLLRVLQSMFETQKAYDLTLQIADNALTFNQTIDPANATVFNFKTRMERDITHEKVNDTDCVSNYFTVNLPDFVKALQNTTKQATKYYIMIVGEDFLYVQSRNENYALNQESQMRYHVDPDSRPDDYSEYPTDVEWKFQRSDLVSKCINSQKTDTLAFYMVPNQTGTVCIVHTKTAVEKIGIENRGFIHADTKIDREYRFTFTTVVSTIVRKAIMTFQSPSVTFGTVELDFEGVDIPPQTSFLVQSATDESQIILWAACSSDEDIEKEAEDLFAAAVEEQADLVREKQAVETEDDPTA